MRMFRVVPMAVMTVAVMWTAGVANAGFIVSTTVPASTNEIRTAGNSNGGITTAVNVGGSNVTINSFGTFGQQLTNGNLKFLIFGTTIGSSPLYSSGSISTLAAASGNQWYDAPSFTSLEGYIDARVFIAGLLAHQGPFTPESLIGAFENLPNLSLGIGASAGFGPTNHQYSSSVWGTSIMPTGSFKNLYFWTAGSAIQFFE